MLNHAAAVMLVDKTSCEAERRKERVESTVMQLGFAPYSPASGSEKGTTTLVEKPATGNVLKHCRQGDVRPALPLMPRSRLGNGTNRKPFYACATSLVQTNPDCTIGHSPAVPISICTVT